jgi:hypothetical protein
MLPNELGEIFVVAPETASTLLGIHKIDNINNILELNFSSPFSYQYNDIWKLFYKYPKDYYVFYKFIVNRDVYSYGIIRVGTPDLMVLLY